MDASDMVTTLHRIDPGFRDICDALYPGLDPREVADQVYGISKQSSALAKGEPDQSDVHVRTTNWRNGRGHTKGRGRRKIDDSVKETRFVSKVDKDKVARNVGMATTGIGTGISAVALPKHLKHLPAAMKNAKTGPSASEGIKNSVKAVRNFSKPPQGTLPGMEGIGGKPGAVKSGLGAMKAGLGVARENPRISAGLVLGATAIHTANLAGEGTATHVLHSGGKKNPDIQATHLSKQWAQAEVMLVNATRNGLITKAEALDLGRAVYADLSKAAYGSMGGSATSNNIKLTALKAPAPVKLDMPKLTPTTTTQPKSVKSGAGSSGKPSKQGVKKLDVGPDAPRTLDITGEISKLNVDKQQCFGWCSVVKVDGKDVIDKQNDMIDIDDIEEAAYDYMLTSRKGGDMHRRTEDGGPHHAADCIESFVLTPEKIEKMGLPESTPQGWWIGMQVHDDDLWDDVKSGRKTKFSIHGSGRRTEVLVND